MLSQNFPEIGKFPISTMESKLIGWSHLSFMVFAVSLHRSSHAQPATSSTWPGTTLKEDLNKTHFGVILVAFLSFIVFLIFFSLMIRHCVDTCATTRTHIISAAVTDREVIDKCPVLVYSDVKDLRIGNSALECAVCLSEFDDSDKIRLLPKCNHVFHPNCIDRWFASRLTCPVCRAKLTPSDADAVTESSNHDESSAADSEQSSEESPGLPAERIGVDDGSGSSSTGLPVETEPPIRSRTTAERLGRSHSTGHCLFMENEGVMERYTLRLPEHVREEKFGKNQRRLRRCASSNDVVLRGEWSSKKRRDNMESWVLLCNMTPPFVSKDWSSVKFVKQNSYQRSPPLRPPV